MDEYLLIQAFQIAPPLTRVYSWNGTTTSTEMLFSTVSNYCRWCYFWTEGKNFWEPLSREIRIAPPGATLKVMINWHATNSKPFISKALGHLVEQLFGVRVVHLHVKH